MTPPPKKVVPIRPPSSSGLERQVDDWLRARAAGRRLHPTYIASMRRCLLGLADRMRARKVRDWARLSAADLESCLESGARGRRLSGGTVSARRSHIRSFLAYLESQGIDVKDALAMVAHRPTRVQASARRAPSSPLMGEVHRYLEERLHPATIAEDWAALVTHTLWDLVEHLEVEGCRDWRKAPAGVFAAVATGPGTDVVRRPERLRVGRAFARFLRSRGQLESGV